MKVSNIHKNKQKLLKTKLSKFYSQNLIGLRTFNMCKINGINTIGDLIQYEAHELWRRDMFFGFGAKAVDELTYLVEKKLGLDFK